jgi:hypothetical protein
MKQMHDATRFYALRDQRTREYGVPDIFDTPVGIVVGPDAAATANGQLATLALVNMAARMHRHLRLRVPAAALIRPTLVPASRLNEAAVALARAIDPFIVIETADPGPIAVGLGADCPATVPWYVGASGQVALLGRAPQPLDDHGGPSLGAALAACLAAGCLCRQVLGRLVRPVRLSAWDCTEGDEATVGPVLAVPLDLGRVLQVGAGGVGACLGYWAWEFEVRGDWRVADRDRITVHNTNRSLPFFPAHAGWPDGEPQYKAAVVAPLVGGTAIPRWYHELEGDPFTPDLVLPLANEYGVRSLVAARGEPVIVHATTSRTWEAQFHRHLPGRDDCIVCRMPEPQAARLACATAAVSAAEQASTDAALPFLSATAGLLLLTGLFRLQHGVLADGAENLLAVSFDAVRRSTRRAVHGCRQGCQTVLPPGVRQTVHRGRRWSHLDPGAAA